MGLDLDQARRQAKELLRAASSGDVQALLRFRADRPPRLADAQAAVAGDLGFRSWPALVRSLLLAAVEDGDVERLRALMADGASVRGSELLLYARNPDVTALLIEGGARLDVRDADGLTPYSRAARFKSETNLRLLAEAGGATELDPAAEWVGAVVRGDLDRADRLKQAHAGLALRWDDCEQLPRWASAGDDQVVVRLLDAGVPIESRGRQEGTALHYAALWGRSSTLRQLLARGADATALAEPPDQPGAQEWTALDWTGWGSQNATAASDRHASYRLCVATLLHVGAVMTERTPIAHLIDEIRESGLEYLPGSPVRVRVRVRGARVDVDDMGGAVAVCGMPPGWREAAEGAVAELGWNVRRNGVVFMQAPHGRRLAWIIERTAAASAAVCDAILQLGDDANSA
ncbi:MAG TPA: ankyrin repeat domain-containing protein [Solirubrobacteraceae bacterium]|jgi:ankyrin repeat protein|nr:ankyrin repeat domain-containing protein [Solirubrobacteraceae bacterium]